MRKVAARSSVVFSPEGRVLGAALRLGPIAPPSTPEGSSYIAPLCQVTLHREWGKPSTPIASSSFREVVLVVTRSSFTLS